MSLSTSSHSRLSGEQIAQFQNDGYTLFHQPVFSPEKFAQLKAIFEENLEKYGEDDLDTMHFRDARLLPFLLCDEVLDLVEPLTGPDIGLWSSHFISKQPFKGKATPWHEDSSYWNGNISTMKDIVTVWLAMDAATPENGCMKVLPGTQQNGYSEYEKVDTKENIFGLQIKPAAINENAAVYFSLQPNQCSLHEARIIHGADANSSPLRRAGYTMRYFPLTSRIFTEKIPNHKIWRARGTDRAGNRFEN